MIRNICLMCFVLLFQNFLCAQQKSGTIRVRKVSKVQGLYVMEEGAYYKTKLYLRFFDNNAAVFLNAPITPEAARDSTARLLYTYRKNPAVYKIINDSVFIEGTENTAPFLYRGIVKDGRLKVRKISHSKEKQVVFKKIL